MCVGSEKLLGRAILPQPFLGRVPCQQSCFQVFHFVLTSYAVLVAEHLQFLELH